MAVVALVLFAVSTLLTRVASDRVDSGLGFLVATTTNVIFCGAATIAYAFIRDDPMTFNLPAFGYFVVAGFFATYLGRYFFFESVVRMGAARASTFGTTSPVFAALFGWMFLGDVLSGGSLVAMALVLVGLALVANRGKAKPLAVAGASAAATAGAAAKSTDTPSGGRPADTWRTLMIIGLGSSAAYAVGNVLRGYGIRSWNEPLLGALIGAGTGLLIQLVFGARRAELTRRFKAADRVGVWLFVGVGVFNISAQVFAIASIRYMPVAESVLIASATPLLVYPASFFLLKNSESITWTSVFGLFLSLLGVGYLVGRPLM